MRGLPYQPKCARSRAAGFVPGLKEDSGDSGDLIRHYSSAIQPLFGERRGFVYIHSSAWRRPVNGIGISSVRGM
ncbi:hypothetical protein XFF7767_990051 [Xanthomonas citri pv. fuscans]|nr:hypothetical protein XFF7767_990051 [Xanthomonas citri pv. fuscans]